MMDKLRNAWRSKTIWFNGVLLALISLFDMVNSAMPQLHEYLADDTYRKIGVVIVVGNIILRFLTTKPLEAK